MVLGGKFECRSRRVHYFWAAFSIIGASCEVSFSTEQGLRDGEEGEDGTTEILGKMPAVCLLTLKSGARMGARYGIISCI